MSNETQGKCPVMHGAAATNSSENSTSVRDWWPNNLNLNILHQHDSKSDPLEDGFDYVEEFSKLDYDALKKDLNDLMTETCVHAEQSILELFGGGCALPLGVTVELKRNSFHIQAFYADSNGRRWVSKNDRNLQTLINETVRDLKSV